MSCRLSSSAAVVVVSSFLVHAACAQTGAVYSVNAMGFQHIPVPPAAMNLASVPYEHLSNGINEVIGQQLTPGPDLNSADAAYFYDPIAQVYKLAYLYTDGTNTFWVDNDSQTAATNPINPGAGFWLRSRQPASQNVIAMGEVPVADAATNAVLAGLQLLAYPYPSSHALSALTLSNNAVRGYTIESADTLYVWNADSQSFRIYYYFADGSLVDYTTGDPATNVLQPGEAFWYKHIGGGFNWVESKPYAWP